MHLIFQQVLRIKDENLVQTQASLAQFRGSSSSLKKMLKTTSSESLENTLSVIVDANCKQREMGIDFYGEIRKYFVDSNKSLVVSCFF